MNMFNITISLLFQSFKSSTVFLPLLLMICDQGCDAQFSAIQHSAVFDTWPYHPNAVETWEFHFFLGWSWSARNNLLWTKLLDKELSVLPRLH